MKLFKDFFGEGDQGKTNPPKNDPFVGKIGDEELQAFYEGRLPEEPRTLPNMEELVVERNQPKVVVPQSKDKAQPNGVEQLKGVVQPVGTTGAIPPKEAKPVYFPRLEETKLYILLVENTKEVAKEKENLEKIVKSLITSGKVCVINYGRIVRESKIVDAKDFDCSELLYLDFVGEYSCLFDALTALKGVVEKNYRKTEYSKNKRVMVKSIEIIGIGRCVDNYSIIPAAIAVEDFCSVVNRLDVTTKYFCLSEKYFVEAAKIGFHSIGSIARNYM